MAEHDDAQSPVGESQGGSTRVSRAHGPIQKAWAWFAAQPAQTKVIVVGVIAVVGIVIWMMFRKQTQPVDTTGEETTGPFRSKLFNSAPGTPSIPATALPPIPGGSTDSSSNGGPAASVPAPTPPAMPAARPMPTATAVTTPTAAPINTPPPVVQPTVKQPLATFPVTPVGMGTPTMQRTDISLSGTIIPIGYVPGEPAPLAPQPDTTPKVTAPYVPSLGAAPSAPAESIAGRTMTVAIPRRAPTPQVARPTVITPVPTQRGTNISF